ncbi:hypothetical protein BDV95DRAFT_634690 [Massariosphaeria phaeospora]|uniref:C3H1-type domain-containing protein n=1 Tax=Massariosphaeria phaeospora TaxID=100035 RepID=A0A7C8MW94_9PLEO|nr:hypothetical protein BDV95DRAFT_634690 [Massariosphaeria phaeospora]
MSMSISEIKEATAYYSQLSKPSLIAVILEHIVDKEKLERETWRQATLLERKTDDLVGEKIRYDMLLQQRDDLLDWNQELLRAQRDGGQDAADALEQSTNAGADADADADALSNDSEPQTQHADTAADSKPAVGTPAPPSKKRKASSSAERSLVVCTQCYGRDLACDSGTPCASCAATNRACRRKQCSAWTNGAYPCQREDCKFAHAEDGYTNAFDISAANWAKQKKKRNKAKKMKLAGVWE